MRNTYMMDTSCPRCLASLVAPAAFALCVLGHAQPSVAQQSEPKTFSSAGEASRALVQAVQNHDEAALDAILGTGRDVTSSGDESVDKLEREQFAQKYQEMHRLVQEPDGTTVLYIGAENWPFPIPLTSDKGGWSFDAKKGAEEILFRQIGENEGTAIEVCRTLVAAKEQEREIESDPIREYARTFVGGPTESTDATAAGGTRGQPALPRILLSSLERSTGKDDGRDERQECVRRQKLCRRGVCRLSCRLPIVGSHDVHRDEGRNVYERDLGPETATLARDIKGRSPASAWTAVK